VPDRSQDKLNGCSSGASSITVVGMMFGDSNEFSSCWMITVDISG